MSPRLGQPGAERDRPPEAEPLPGDGQGRLEGQGQPAQGLEILAQGVCDGCALGVAGFHDWTLDVPSRIAAMLTSRFGPSCCW